MISAETLGKKITDSPTVKSNPILSSDGELIAYTSNVEGVEEIWIYDLVTEENYQLALRKMTTKEVQVLVVSGALFFRLQDPEYYLFKTMVELPEVT